MRVIFKIFPLLGFLLLIVLLLSAPSFAAVGDENAIDTIVKLYRDNTSAWEQVLQQSALGLFSVLATIQLAASAIRLVLQKSDASEWVYEFSRQCLYIGFFLTLLLNSSAWAKSIVESFRVAADSANGAVGGLIGLSPSDIFEIGLNLAGKMTENPPTLNMTYMAIVAIGAITTLICFALMAAFLVVALIESYVVISAGSIFMGFGGSQWTSDLAKNILKYAVSVGAKLFVLQLLIGLGQRIMLSWVTELDPSDIDTIFAIVGSSFVFVILTLMVPNIIQGLVNGTSFGSSSVITNAGSAVGAAAGTVVSAGLSTMGAAGVLAGGVGSALHGASKLASEQLATATSEGSGPKSRIGRAASWTKKTAMNLTTASIDDVGGRISGRSRHGYMGGRMGHSMREQASEMEAKRTKPKEPHSVATATSIDETKANTIGGENESS